jgi:hypothetical protein
MSRLEIIGSDKNVSILDKLDKKEARQNRKSMIK